MMTRWMQAGSQISARLKHTYHKSPKMAMLSVGVVAGLLIGFMGVGRAARTTEPVKVASRDPLAIIETMDASLDSIEFFTGAMQAMVDSGMATPSTGRAGEPSHTVRFSLPPSPVVGKRAYRFSQEDISRHVSIVSLESPSAESTPDIWPQRPVTAPVYYIPPFWWPDRDKYPPPGPTDEEDDPNETDKKDKFFGGSDDPDLIVSSTVPLPSTLVLIAGGLIGILGIRHNRLKEEEGGYGL